MPPALQPGLVCLLLSILSFLCAHAQPADMCARARDGQQTHGTVLVGHVISTQVIDFFSGVCRPLREEPFMFQRQLLRHERHVRVERQNVVPQPRTHDLEACGSLLGHPSPVHRLQWLILQFSPRVQDEQGGPSVLQRYSSMYKCSPNMWFLF